MFKFINHYYKFDVWFLAHENIINIYIELLKLFNKHFKDHKEMLLMIIIDNGVFLVESRRRLYYNWKVLKTKKYSIIKI